MLEVITAAARAVVEDLGRGMIHEVFARCDPSEVTEEVFREVLREHHVRLVSPATGQFRITGVYPVDYGDCPTWAVEAPVWTAEEGESDLTLSMLIEVRNEVIGIKLTNFRVL